MWLRLLGKWLQTATMSAEARPTPVVREVRELRHSSRLLVRVLGLMQNRLEGGACTPAQCHVLMELADRGRLTTGELAELLQIDKSTASRTLRPLLDQVEDAEERAELEALCDGLATP